MTKIYVACLIQLCLILNVTDAFSQVTYSVSGSVPSGFPTTGLTSISRWVYADFDNDGDADILYQNSNTSGSGIHYLQNDGAGSYTDIAADNTGKFSAGPFSGLSFTFISQGGLSTATQLVADYDNDGDVDIVEISSASGERYLQNTNGVWAVATNPTGFPATGYFATRWVTGDYDNDGDIDILYQTGASGTGINLLVNDGKGTYSTIAADGTGKFNGGPFSGISFTFISIAANSAQYLGDYDGDGDDDIFEINGSGATRYLTNNAGSWSVGTAPTGFPASGFGANNRWVVADYDGDGDVDILYQTANTANQNIFYLQNNGSGSYTSTAASTAGTFTGTPFNGITFSWIGQYNNNGNQQVIDIDNDGDLDIFEITTTTSRYIVNGGAAPLLASSNPATGATSVDRNANIQLTLSQAVTAGTGNIYIRKASDSSLVETIAAAGARVTGTGTTTIAIDPVTTLAASTSYFLTFDLTAFKNSAAEWSGKINIAKRRVQASTSASLVNFTTASTLPVTVIDISARQEGSAIRVSWATALEQNSRDFLIEHSLDGVSWTTIGTVAAAGNNSTPLAYSFQDRSPAAGNNLYRLRQRDLDGAFIFSPVVTATFAAGSRLLSIQGNPVQDGVLRVYAPVAMRVVIVSAAGAPVLKGQFAAGVNQLHVSNWPKGNYVLKGSGSSILFSIR